MTEVRRRPIASTGLDRLLESPDVARVIQRLPGDAFMSLVREVGVEDAGELVALATTEQLVASFDEDLFRNAEPGQREVFDPARFVTWLEVLLEAGDAVVARRISQLSEDFVARAISSLVLVFDYEALRERMVGGDPGAAAADRALETALSEEIDGYLLVARTDEGWDAVLALVLALDRDHRELLVRILDRCAALDDHLVDDLDELAETLSAPQSLAEDVEAEREARRSKLGFVEPRAARAFLKLSQQSPDAADRETSDPLTRAYFRELEAGRPSSTDSAAQDRPEAALAGAPDEDVSTSLASSTDAPPSALVGALRMAHEQAPEVFGRRMQELAYLANVLVAGTTTGEGTRFTPGTAARAALATVELGVMLLATAPPGAHLVALRPEDLLPVLLKTSADVSFRAATAALAGTGLVEHPDAVVEHPESVPSLYERLRQDDSVARNPRARNHST